MRPPSRFIFGHLFASILLVLGIGTAEAHAQGSIFGVARDSSGSPLPNVPLLLSDDTAPAVALSSTTDTFGAFHFDHLALRTYRLSPDRQRYNVFLNDPITLSTGNSARQLNLTLTSAGESPAKPQGLQLQAAGIRGYIDPGGYSAPAGAAAASKLIQGVADLNRANNDGSAAMCDRGPIVLKTALDHPDSADAQRELGRFYLATHQPEKALTSLQRARALDAHDPGTLLPLAEALLQNRQFAAAHDLLSANDAGMEKASVHRLLAQSDEGLGKFQQASLEYQAAAVLEPSEANFYGAGYELILAGSAAAAGNVFESAIARYPNSTTLLMGEGTVNFLLGRAAEATGIFLRCATLHPEDARLYPFLSASFVISGVEPVAVAAAFQKYEELFPASADAAYFYALILLAQTSNRGTTGSANAEALLKHAVRLNPRFAKAHLQLGSLYFEGGNAAEAAEEFATALRLDPTLWETHYKLSQAYRRAGQPVLANEQMQLFLAKKTQNTTENQASGIHLEQFLSVFERTSTQSNTTTPCLDKR